MNKKPRRARIRDRVKQLKEDLIARIEAEDNKIKHAENYSTKIVGMLGDMAKQIIVNTDEVEALTKRVERLEQKLEVNQKEK